ncbi:Endonuclease/exonuclease/phosphatase [Cunninghamella echinulata]|nr:Endonuclease/exonuclease/phosphatase [Cunninghamella echinulata]
MLKIDTNNLTSPWLKVQALTKVIQFKSDTKGPIKTPLFGSASSKAKTEEHNTDRLKIFIASWNMYGRLVSELDSFLNSNKKNKQERMDQQSSSNKIFVEHDGESPFLDSSSTHPYHLIVIGTQECERDIAEALFFPSKEVWERRLSDYLGECYQLLECETLAALHLAVFVWKPVASYVRAVAISLNFGSRSLLFINCHLRAHQTKLTERNANVHRILHELQIKGGISSHKHASKKNLRLSMDKLSRVSSSIMVKNNNKKKDTRDTKKNKDDPNSTKTTPTPTSTPRKSNTKEIIKPSKNVIERFDHVFFFGDTNYRINAERKTVLEAIQKKDFVTLLKHDQLSIERQNGTSPLSAFKEHTIQFIPTYKFDTLEIPSSSSSSSSSSFGTDSPTSSLSIMIQQNQQQQQQQQTPTLLSPETPSTATTTSSSSSSILITPTDTFQLHSPMSVCYDTSPKQRVPSFTDRILWSDKKLDDTNNNNSRPSLIRSATTFSNSPSTTTTTARPKLKNIKWISAMKWKNNNNNHDKNEEVINKETVCYHYDAVMDQRLIGASDHLPVVGVFGVWFNEWDLQKRAKSIKSIKKNSLWKKWKSWS